MDVRRLAVVAVVLGVAVAAAEGYNITKILGEHPEYSQFNKLLTETRLAGDINRRRTITVLVVANGDMGALTSGHYSLQTIRHILEMHILVDYYGAKKLHQLARGDTASSSMFQPLQRPTSTRTRLARTARTTWRSGALHQALGMPHHHARCKAHCSTTKDVRDKFCFTLRRYVRCTETANQG